MSELVLVADDPGDLAVVSLLNLLLCFPPRWPRLSRGTRSSPSLSLSPNSSSRSSLSRGIPSGTCMLCPPSVMRLGPINCSFVRVLLALFLLTGGLRDARSGDRLPPLLLAVGVLLDLVRRLSMLPAARLAIGMAVRRNRCVDGW